MKIKAYKKTATIDAVQWDGTEYSTWWVIEWAAGFGVGIQVRFDVDSNGETVKVLSIPTLEGPMTASVGDFISRGIKNEFWAIKPDVMALTYQEV